MSAVLRVETLGKVNRSRPTPCRSKAAFMATAGPSSSRLGRVPPGRRHSSTRTPIVTLRCAAGPLRQVLRRDSIDVAASRFHILVEMWWTVINHCPHSLRNGPEVRSTPATRKRYVIASLRSTISRGPKVSRPPVVYDNTRRQTLV